MAMKQEVHHIDTERRLYDVMDIICKHLKLRDLCNIAKVCKSWRYAALREERRRSSIKELRLPYKINNLSSTLDNTPFASLIIYDSALESSLSRPSVQPGIRQLKEILEEKLLERFRKKLPNKTIVLGVNECLTTDDPQFQGVFDIRLTGYRNVMGFFLPNVQGRIRVHASWFHFRDHLTDATCRRHTLLNRVVEDLGLDDCDYAKTTIIRLSTWNYCSADIMYLDQRAKQSGIEVTWGSVFGGKLVAAEREAANRSRDNRQLAVYLRISGPSLESWSTFIHFFASRDEIERKLRELRGRARRKRHCTGLCYAYKCYSRRCSHAEHPSGNSCELVASLKRYFPGVRFTGYFVKCHFYHPMMRADDLREQYPDRSDVKDPLNDRDFVNNLHVYTSIIIISYD